MVDLIVRYLPWLLSAITIYMTVLIGDKNIFAWILALINSALWLTWIVLSATWGLIPMNLVLWVVYFRNYLKWRKNEV